MSEAASGWFSIGHSTRHEERTGCTVILFDDLVPVVADVRGGAPGTRETSLLEPGRLVGRADAILLTGGSAFGLAAADGVVQYLSELGRGYPTSARPVPIVPAAVIYDLSVGSPHYPTVADGYTAASTAARSTGATGLVGAGTGATVAKIGDGNRPSGLGIASFRAGEVHVTAVVVLNAVGDVVDPTTGLWLAVTGDPEGLGRRGRELATENISSTPAGEHTTIGGVLISAPVSRDTLVRCCVAAHDALARCVIPAHTIFDGDTFFAAAPAESPVMPSTTLAIAAATEVAVERAIVGIFEP